MRRVKKIFIPKLFRGNKCMPSNQQPPPSPSITLLFFLVGHYPTRGSKILYHKFYHLPSFRVFYVHIFRALFPTCDSIFCSLLPFHHNPPTTPKQPPASCPSYSRVLTAAYAQKILSRSRNARKGFFGRHEGRVVILRSIKAV